VLEFRPDYYLKRMIITLGDSSSQPKSRLEASPGEKEVIEILANLTI